jgi:hypothetical protein
MLWVATVFGRWRWWGGRFELSGVTPGDYYLVARRNALPPAGGSGMAAVQPVTVGDKAIDGIVLTLAPGRDVTR